MSYIIIIIFFLLIGVSLSARILNRKSSECGCFMFSLKTVPMSCAFMGFAYFLSFAGMFLLARELKSSMLFFLSLTLLPLIILGFGFWRFFLHARKSQFSAIKAAWSFILGFAFSVALTATVLALNMYYCLNTWQSVEIPTSPKCELQLKRLFTLCAEYDRRILFESKKKIAIRMDPCGISDFYVYALKNGAAYLECESAYGASYIIDAANEKVYSVNGAGMSELTGERTEEPNSVIYYTHGNGKKVFISCTISLGDLLKGKRLLGHLHKTSFRPCENDEQK